jgi:hypothetical protein
MHAFGDSIWIFFVYFFLTILPVGKYLGYIIMALLGIIHGWAKEKRMFSEVSFVQKKSRILRF